MAVIKSISDNQEEIINWILELYSPNFSIDLDPTFSKGNFYKNIKEPQYKFDLYPQRDDVVQADCRNLPLEDNSIKTIMFDPPFIVGGDKNKEATGIIRKRFGYYRTMEELFGMYHDAMKEFYRILEDKGILIFKCQDSVSCSKNYFSHVEIINVAIKLGFYPKDMFILLAKNRIIDSKIIKQQHARKFHSYFLVFIKEKCKIKYSHVNS